MRSERILSVAIVTLVLACCAASAEEQPSLAKRLAELPAKLVFETYVDDNWELFIANADGSEATNLTRTPDVHELYPQASPDGSMVCFIFDRGRGRNTVRSVGLINVDGSDRRLVAEYARQPCWHPNSRTIAFLPQEYKKFNIVDYYSKGLSYYDVDSGRTRPHPNAARLHHLYNPSFAANGKWIAATVHAGMGYSHTILLIEADGPKIINLDIGGCRPCLAPDGKRIAWGRDDHRIIVAELDVDQSEPRVGKQLMEIINDKRHKIYHVDWSPDGNYVSFSRGPDGKGDTSKPGTYEAACEMVGVYAADWDLYVVPVIENANVDLNQARSNAFHQVTASGNSNKESDWLPSH